MPNLALSASLSCPSALTNPVSEPSCHMHLETAHRHASKHATNSARGGCTHSLPRTWLGWSHTHTIRVHARRQRTWLDWCSRLFWTLSATRTLLETHLAKLVLTSILVPSVFLRSMSQVLSIWCIVRNSGLERFVLRTDCRNVSRAASR